MVKMKDKDEVPTRRLRVRSEMKVMLKKVHSSAGQLFEKLGGAGTSKHVFTGMIKPVDNDDLSIMFARAGDCSKWIKIPANQVADIKLLHIVHCDGHTHPLVHLFMEEPASPEGMTFAELADLYSASAAVGGPFPEPPMVDMFRRQPGSTPCYWDWTRNRWIC